MIPAPAQGAMLVVAGMTIYADAPHLNDIETEIATYIERQFQNFEGGCTAPIGALTL
jgi:porphobilinogen deaminase